jgi:hypothetical protein
VGTGRGGTKLHASVAGSRITAFLATAAPWEPYFTDNPRTYSKSVSVNSAVRRVGWHISGDMFYSIQFTIFYGNKLNRLHSGRKNKTQNFH